MLFFFGFRLVLFDNTIGFETIRTQPESCNRKPQISSFFEQSIDSPIQDTVKARVQSDWDYGDLLFVQKQDFLAKLFLKMDHAKRNQSMNHFEIFRIDHDIPSEAQCLVIMESYSMLPNIIEHSFQVMRVAAAITDHLQNGLPINRQRVIGGALLHDITKTRSLSTRERHDESGAALMREIGFPDLAEIVEQHVRLQNLNLDGMIEEKEIVYYADKRVMHDKIVSVDDRFQDLLIRYGLSEETRRRILQNKDQVFTVEKKLARFMTVDPDRAIEKIK